MALEQPPDQGRIGRGLRPDHHPGRAPGEHLVDRLLGAQAAAHLDRHASRTQKAARERTVVAPAERAVQIDEVDPAGAVARELPRHGHGVVGVGGRALRLALAQADHSPALHVNGGVELHRRKGS